MAIITLTTDFGMRDPYVAAMKGVLRRYCPDATIDDLTHDIAPQDVLEAALFIEAVFPWYPEGAVHLVVVDPGVGTARRPVAVHVGGQSFVGPDNGLLTLWLQRHKPDWAYQINPEALRCAAVSNTFHGRDVFAPAAAWLAKGGDPVELGAAVSDLKHLQVPEPAHHEKNRTEGVVIHIDRFGNCVTNIRREHTPANDGHNVRIGDCTFPLVSTYGDVPSGMPLALFGSGDRLEIAVNQGNAARQFGFARMTPVTLGQ